MDDIIPENYELRKDLKFKIHPDSRWPFDHFSFIVPSMVEEMNAFIRETVDKTTFLDIGALHGVFSLAFAAKDPNRRVLAIDSSPVAFSRLLYNISNNPFPNSEAMECAVSDTSGKIRMHYEWEHVVAAGTTGDDGVIEVVSNSGDNICEEKQFFPDVIKIDVEGHEVKVLEGLQNVIRKCRPVIFLEIHPDRIVEEGSSVLELESTINELSYLAKAINGESFPLHSIRDLSVDERIVLYPN